MFFNKLSNASSNSTSRSHPQNSKANTKTTITTITTTVTKPINQRPTESTNIRTSNAQSEVGTKKKRVRHSSEPLNVKERKRKRLHKAGTEPTEPKSSDSPSRNRRRRIARSYNANISDDEDGNSNEENWDLNIRKLSASATATQSPEPQGVDNQLLFERQLFSGTTKEDETSSVTDIEIINSAQLVERTAKSVGYRSLFDVSDRGSSSLNDAINFTVELPFGSEKYLAVIPSKPEETNPIDELIAIFEIVASTFVPDEYSDIIKHPSGQDCILRRFRRSIKNKDSTAFLASIKEFNELIVKLRESGQIAQRMKSFQQEQKQSKQLPLLPLPFTYELLNQVYRRVVSPRTQELRDYKAFSSNVYGELLPRFVSEIFRQTRLTPSSVFIDLGSGVGNCALQAALEIGCEAWGCEIMKTASELATQQKKELEDRAKLYRIKMGSINVISADFVQDNEIHRALSRSDVLLVNNYAFDAELNGKLVDMFLDLKDGCKIVSLRSFVPPGHVITEHNRESPINILSVEKRHFGKDSVSWTTAGGDYYVATVDRSRLNFSK